MKVDNRHHSIARVRLPVVIQTPTGLFDGKTEDFSVGGAFIRLSRELKSNHNLSLVLNAKGRFIPRNARIVRSDERNLSDQRRFLLIGVRFTRMMLHEESFFIVRFQITLRLNKLSPIRRHRMERGRVGEAAHRRTTTEQE